MYMFVYSSSDYGLLGLKPCGQWFRTTTTEMY